MFCHQINTLYLQNLYKVSSKVLKTPDSRKPKDMLGFLESFEETLYSFFFVNKLHLFGDKTLIGIQSLHEVAS